MKRNSNTIFSLLGIAISISILAFILRDINFAAVGNEFKSMQLGWTPLLVFLLLLMNVFRALRWNILLPKDKRCSLVLLFESILVGFTATFLLPLRAGELVRAVYLSRIHSISFSSAFASIVSERVLDIITLLALLGASLIFLPNISGFVSAGAWSLGLIALVFGVLILVSYLRPRAVLVFTFVILRVITQNQFSRFSRKILRMAHEFILGMKSISSLKELSLVLLFSAAVWLTNCIFYWIAIFAMGQDSVFLVGVITTIMIAFAVAAPSAPGFIGTFQAGCILALSVVFPLSESFALAYSIFVHALQAAFIILLGFYFMGKRGFGLQELTKKQR